MHQVQARSCEAWELHQSPGYTRIPRSISCEPRELLRKLLSGVRCAGRLIYLLADWCSIWQHMHSLRVGSRSGVCSGLCVGGGQGRGGGEAGEVCPPEYRETGPDTPAGFIYSVYEQISREGEEKAKKLSRAYESQERAFVRAALLRLLCAFVGCRFRIYFEV